jgi:homoserine O-acetyltransferase
MPKGYSTPFPFARGSSTDDAMAEPGYSLFRSDEPFTCEHGGVLPGFQLAYETWGTLDATASNAILLHTGLSASSHAKSNAADPSSGWWEEFIGPGAALDTDRFFVICTNVLGGCFGSTGPASLNPATERRWAMELPVLTVSDMVAAQLRLLDELGIERLHASVGSSLGGMQSLAVAHMAPSRVANIVSISAAAACYPLAIAMRFAQRTAVMSDPAWRNGDYYDHKAPCVGLKVARQMGTISYRSGPDWDLRFGRKRADGPPTFGVDFEVESYLDHQGRKFCKEYDANSYLYVSKAMDLFDVTDGLSGFRGNALVMGVTSDLLFPVWQQREAAKLLEDAGVDTTYIELDAPHGHDTFLVLVDEVGAPIKHMLER